MCFVLCIISVTLIFFTQESQQIVLHVLHKQFISNSCDCFLAESEYLWLTLCYKGSVLLVLYCMYAALFGTANNAKM